VKPYETVRILIVDDEIELRETLAEQLKPLTVQVAAVTYGLEIETAANGREALEKFDTMAFDALMTDINMPGMNGLELLAALRGRGSDVPSIILTAFGDRTRAAEAVRLGCFAFLEKPWKISILRKTVGRALERGLGLRRINGQVESKVDAFSTVDKTRQRQLRTVFRSMLVGDDGAHRNDVCQVPPAKTGTKKPA
jgi:CheY-like chemotaxis protein